MTEVIDFGSVRVRIFNAAEFMETVFIDGTRAPARPEDTDEYRATAERLGYGDNVWLMTREHEIAHTLLAHALGLPWSQALFDVAHGRNARTQLNGAEEDMVLAFQRWKRLRGEAIE